jgi:hypothetical protein
MSTAGPACCPREPRGSAGNGTRLSARRRSPGAPRGSAGNGTRLSARRRSPGAPRGSAGNGTRLSARRRSRGAPRGSAGRGTRLSARRRSPGAPRGSAGRETRLSSRRSQGVLGAWRGSAGSGTRTSASAGDERFGRHGRGSTLVRGAALRCGVSPPPEHAWRAIWGWSAARRPEAEHRRVGGTSRSCQDDYPRWLKPQIAYTDCQGCPRIACTNRHGCPRFDP